MALRQAVLPSLSYSIIPSSIMRTALRPGDVNLFSRQLSISFFPQLSIAISNAIHLNIPQLLSGLWESILRAVPKKKTSHSKKRSRFMAGKALKDVTNLNRCSACGNTKRAHILCPYCVQGMPRQKSPRVTHSLTFLSQTFEICGRENRSLPRRQQSWMHDLESDRYRL